MTNFTCQQCGRSYQLKNPKKRVFCSCGAVDWDINPDMYRSVSSDKPGTDLANLLAGFGIQEKQGCSCKTLADEMDRNGVQWCLDNHESILHRMRENAKRYSWLETFQFAARNATNPLAISLAASGDLIRGILDEALRRAKQKVAGQE